MKTKKLKAVTLAELVIVMAIFGMIMMGAISLVGPVRELFANTQRYENVRASMDNVNNILESTVRNANRMHVYVGWKDFDSINDADITATWGNELSALTGGGAAYLTWGKLAGNSAKATNPIDYFRKHFFLADMTLIGNFSHTFSGTIPGTSLDWADMFSTSDTTVDFEQTIVTEGRGSLDASLADNTLDIYVLGVIHKETDDPITTVDERTEIEDIFISTYRSGVKISETHAINPVYLKNYDFKLIFGQAATDLTTNKFLWSDDPATPDDLIFYGNNTDARINAVPEADPNKMAQGNFFYNSDNIFSITLMARPKATTKEPNPTYNVSNLIMTNAMKLDRMRQKNGDDITEVIYFNVKSSKLSYTNSTVKPSYANFEAYDPVRGDKFADIPSVVGTFSYNNYPIRPYGTITSGSMSNIVKGQIMTGEDLPYNPLDQYASITNPFVANGYYDLSFIKREPEEQYRTNPEVKKFEEHYNATLGINWNHELNVAQSQNVFFVFTLPKDFSLANVS